MGRWRRLILALGFWAAFARSAHAQSDPPKASSAAAAPGVSTAAVAASSAAAHSFMEELWTSTAPAPPPVMWLQRRVADTFGWAFGPVSRGLHVAGVDLGGGFDTDSDLLKPFADRGFNELLNWDSRIVITDQGYGLHAQYRKPGFFKKLAISITEKQDIAAAMGLGSVRDGVYRAVGLSPQLPDHGYNAGVAAVVSPYLGFNASYDRSKYFSDDDTVFNRRAAFGVGLTPLGTNGGKDWNVTLVPTLYYDWVDDLNAGLPDVKDGVGFGVGPDYYHGLEQYRLPWVFQHVRPDRVDITLTYANTKIGGVETSLSMNLTAYLTHWVKLSLGASLNYYNVLNQFTTSSETGASLRITFFDFPM